MSAKFKALQPQLTSAKRIPGYKRAPAALHNLLRSQFRIQTWLALGGAFQLLLIALPVRRYLAAAPVLVYLVWTLVDHALMLAGLKHNFYNDGTIFNKYTALIPNEDGDFSKAGSESEKVCVFMLGFRANHILGPLSPGAAEVQKHATGMYKELEAKADETGLLGICYYLNGAASETMPDIMTLMYFKSREDVIRYATGPLHRKAWDWFGSVTAKYPYLGISHELYEVPAGRWENIYKNIHPTGIALTQHKIIDPEGNERWASPIVDAKEGKLATTYGRYT